MGASGMAASEAKAAVVELEPTQAARLTNSSYGYLAADWKDWMAEQGGTGLGTFQRGYAAWAIDFNAGPISSAKFRMNPINASSAYGIPAGANVHFELINEPWTSSTPKPLPDTDGPNVGSTPGTEALTVIAPGGDFDADVTSLLVNWQANPSAYTGIRVYAEAERGGIYAPNDTVDGTGKTANLVLTQGTVPEPATLGALALGGLAMTRRRRQ